MDRDKKPRRRAWVDGPSVVTVAIFALSWRLFEAIIEDPALADNQGFMLLAQAVIVTGAIGLVASYYFSASKNDTEDKEVIRKQADALAAGNDPAWISPALAAPPVEDGELPPEKRITP